MLKIAQYNCPHCKETVELDIMVTAPKWDELYAEQICPLCLQAFDGKANKLMSKAVPEVTYRTGSVKGRCNSGGW